MTEWVRTLRRARLWLRRAGAGRFGIATTKIPAPRRPEVTTRTHVLQSHNLLPQLCSVRALNRSEQETW